jgi:hypothetical protein
MQQHTVRHIQILLATYNALLGRIDKDVRAITIDWDDTSYTIVAYFSRSTTDDDIKTLQELTREIAAAFPDITTFKEEAEYSEEPFLTLVPLKEWVFIRKGEVG